MSGGPKGLPEPEQEGVSPDRAAQQDRDATTVLTPLPSDTHLSEAANISDAPTLVDLPSGTLIPNAAPIHTVTRRSPAPSPELHQTQLPAGTILGQRYEIVAMLGEGGMGAVYKAIDRELNRPVALKVIRPDLARNKAIIERFKQELLLARDVTHRNVIRIYDLGEAAGMKFITMEYVEGEDLRSLLLEKKKLSPEEAVNIIRQICHALDAVHSVGIVHRDLKPQNVMLDKTGRVLVMDFGLARMVESDGMTQTGALVGTMDYMSPEQALAKPLDQRSDIYTLGLIFYELLTGKMPFAAESALASLIRRTRERATPVLDSDGAIPVSVSNIVGKCLERDVNLRYQSTGELRADLDAWEGNRAGVGLTFHANVEPWGRGIPWPMIATVATVLVLAATGFLLRNKLFGPKTASAPRGPVSVLVADFQNDTSDTLFDGTLEPMFNVALEGASFINAYSRGTARQLAEKLPHPSSKLDEQAARLVAVSQGINAIVMGSLSLRGNGYRLSVETIDAVTGKTLATADISAENKDDLLLAIPKLAAPVRKALGDTTPESVQLAATQGSFAAGNLEAVHRYSIGMEQQSAGKIQDALRSFSKAAELDPNFARAYAGMAAALYSVGNAQKANEDIKLALAHVDRMSERERYRVRGLYYIGTENWQKCVEEYGELTKQYPADDVGQNNLALCYGRLLNMPKAMEVAQRALQLAPKDVPTRMNFSLYACYATDFQSCERESRAVLQINPAYEGAFLALAYAQLGQNQLSQATETYQKLEKVSARGASLAASGMANLALYQGRLHEGIQIFEKGAAADVGTKNPDAAADKFVMLTYANLLRGEKQPVMAAARSALANSQSAKIRFLAARAFVEVGETATARKLAAGLASELQAEPQAYAKLVLGEAALKEHNPSQAIQLFTEARNLLDTWIGRFDLGRAYVEAGAFAEADSEFDRCLKRRGEALELFMDDMPTYSYLPIVYYYQARVREGLKSPGFADSYRIYLSIRGNSTDDPLVAEVRRRIGQ